MSQDKIAMVERFFEARSQGDLSYLEFIDPDAVFDLSQSRATHQGVYRGHEEIRKQWECASSCFRRKPKRWRP